MTLVNCTDGHGVTALHVAANAGYDDVVKALLETGDIDVDSKPLQGKSVRMLVRSYPKNVQQILQEYLVSREMGMDVG
ncbi:hypothetical protein L873DRAFT_1823355 [Choiromyces venosus 120613-1]|uniref:Uncharacterized protein n=1 Tax=Choiromyces venosus 120613-1 TaxID=1336337 RepID=A0A3N4ITQ1_9PEZI|nr:hypothetical protein L873DRAFT_1823355 [Choiromyces venosus 120613-1]